MKNEDKIGFMYGQFGMAEGKCKDCSNYKRWKYGEKRYIRKCRVYGISQSVATDWKGSFNACGMYNKNPEGVGNMYKRNKGKSLDPLNEKPLPGQIEFKFGGNDG